MRRPVAAGFALLLASGCGLEQKPTEGTPNPGLALEPASAQLTANQRQQFALSPSTVQVSWSVVETNGGSVNQTGLYTAPSSSGVFHVVATSTTNAAIKAQAVVTVASGVGITATSPVSAFACEATTLSATVTGSSDTGVIWSAPASCGTITAAGVFTSLRGTGRCVVTATAHADAAAVASITVNVAQERVLSVAVLPGTVSLGPGGTRTFSATVTTACGTFPAGS